MNAQEYEREIGHLKFSLAGARDRAESAEARAAQAEQQRDTLERRVEQMQDVIDALNADNDALEAQLKQAKKLERDAIISLIPSSREVDLSQVCGWENMTQEEKRMWRAGYFCGVCDYQDRIISRNILIEAQS